MIVIAGEYGQLGNRLIVYANFIAAAQEFGWRVANPAFYNYADSFAGPRGDWLARYPAQPRERPAPQWRRRMLARSVNRGVKFARKFRNRLGAWPPRVRVHDIGWFDDCDLERGEFHALASAPGLLFAKGWRFRAPAALEKHAAAVRAHLQPRPEYEASAAATVAHARERGDVVIGVHIRQGDYHTYLDGRFYYETPRYVEMLDHLATLFQPRRVAFVACSNAPHATDCFGARPVVRGPGQEIADMLTLARCDRIVGPPSTYTLWASFFGQTPLYLWRRALDRPTPEQFDVVRNFNRTAEDIARELDRPTAPPTPAAAPEPVAAL